VKHKETHTSVVDCGGPVGGDAGETLKSHCRLT
jgi:hypothetical protein